MSKKVQIIEGPDGRPAYAVLRWDEFERLSDIAEDRADAAGISAARDRAEETFPQTVADRLQAGEHPVKVFREYRDMTQAVLAAATDTTATYISQIETGHRKAGRKLQARLANILKIEIADLD